MVDSALDPPPLKESGSDGRDGPVSNSDFLSVALNLCVGCGYCVEACNHSALLVEGFCVVSHNACVKCLACLWSCPVGALHFRGAEE